MGRLAVTTEKWLLIKRQTFCTILHYKNLLPGGESSTFHIWSSRCKFLVTIVFIVKFLCHFLHVLHMCSAAGKTHNISTSNIQHSFIYLHTFFCCSSHTFLHISATRAKTKLLWSTTSRWLCCVHLWLRRPYLRPQFISCQRYITSHVDASLPCWQRAVVLLPRSCQCFTSLVLWFPSNSFLVFQAFSLYRLYSTVQLVSAVYCCPLIERTHAITVFNSDWVEWEETQHHAAVKCLTQVTADAHVTTSCL